MKVVEKVENWAVAMVSLQVVQLVDVTVAMKGCEMAEQLVKLLAVHSIAQLAERMAAILVVL